MIQEVRPRVVTVRAPTGIGGDGGTRAIFIRGSRNRMTITFLVMISIVVQDLSPEALNSPCQTKRAWLLAGRVVGGAFDRMGRPDGLVFLARRVVPAAS